MKNTKTITILCLLASVMIAPFAIAESATVLLKQGIYVEETEGDLDKAIEIYKQVLDKAAKIQRLASRATFQIGMCHLKKGEKEKAAEYFQQVVSKYPTQKTLVKKAQRELSKLPPTEDVTSKSYVIHYKAIDQSKDAFELLNKNYPRGVRTHHANRYRKNGKTIDSIRTDNETGKDKIVAAINDSDELELVKVDSPVSKAKLPAGSTEDMMTQEGHNTIDTDGLIHFQSTHRVSNNNTEPITTTRFINSDFVSLTKMYEEDGTAIPFKTTHEGNIYRYKVTFNKPIMPGESFVYYTEGTKCGLIKPVPGSKDVFQYSMVHSPAAGQPVLRIETFLLPENAVFISTSTPDIQKTEKDGRIELRVEKVVPANGSIATEFQYELPEPLKLDPAPWTDGEIMKLRLKRPGGKEYGTIIYSAQSGTVDDIETWQIIAHMHVTEGNISQYTFVEAEAETFAPLVGQTTNWMGGFVAEYTKENVKLTANGTTKDYPVSRVVYDNEQALYLIRRMPLAEDYHGKFPIFPVQGGGGTVVECRIKVLAVEDVTVEAGSYTCYKTDLSIYYGGAVTLQHTLWFSADEHKYLVKYDVGGAATMELAKVWQRQTDQPLTYENTKKGFSVSVPADWRFYKYGSKLQLMAPNTEPWALFMWQKRGTDPDSASALTIAKADFEKLKDSFTNYTVDQSSWTELTLSGLQAAQYIATYQKSGTGLKAYPKPKEMIEYRTYIVDESTVYWFVFRVEKDDFEGSRDALDYIINSFKANEKI